MSEKPHLSRALQQAVLLLAVVLLTLPFIYPFVQGQHPASGDGLLNLYRIVALDFSVKNGDLYPRFASAFHFGFGGPNFNYYSPLSYYFPVLAHQLIGLSFPLAFRVSVVVYALIAAAGAYQLGKVWQMPALVTAAAYLYAPPLFSTWDRISQLLAYAILPWLLWALWRLAQQRTRLNAAFVTGLFAALLLSHNITGLVSSVFIVAYVLFLASNAEDRLWPLASMVGALGTGVILTTFFWLPALTEQQFVQLNLLEIERFDFRNNFVPLAQMFTPRQAISLGLPQLVIGLIGLVAVFIANVDRSWRCLMLLLAGCIFGACFLASSASLWVWETAPLLSIVLFPQRFMFVAALFLALLTGAGAYVLFHRLNPTLTAALSTAFVGLMMLYALPVMTVGYLTDDQLGEVETIHDLHDFERGGYLGATSNGEFLPIWVEERPHSWQLTDRFYTADAISRLLPNEHVTVVAETWNLKRVDMNIIVTEATTLRFEWLYFPGWQATINGRAVVPYPIDAQGFVAVDVPVDAQTLTLRFGATPVRIMAVISSLVGLAAFAAGLVWLPIERQASTRAKLEPLVSTILTAGIAIGVLLIRAL